jgi:hypothetical protein
VVATRAGNLLTYCLAGAQFKLVNHLVVKKNYKFDLITVSRKGELIILSEKRCQHLYAINKYSLNSEEKEEELKLFWGMGQVGSDNTVSLSSPAVHERVCSLSANRIVQLWSFKGR